MEFENVLAASTEELQQMQKTIVRRFVRNIAITAGAVVAVAAVANYLDKKIPAEDES